MPRPVIWQRFTSTDSCHEPPLRKFLHFAFKPRTDIDLNPTTTQKGGRESARIIPYDERA